MIFKIRTDREVSAKGPEGSGTRRRSISYPGGSMTLILGAQPTYLECDMLPREIAQDEHLLVQEVSPGTVDVEITIINLKAERVQEPESSALIDPGALDPNLKAERVQEPASLVDPGTLDPNLKAERVQEPASMVAPADEPELAMAAATEAPTTRKRR